MRKTKPVRIQSAAETLTWACAPDRAGLRAPFRGRGVLAPYLVATNGHLLAAVRTDEPAPAWPWDETPAPADQVLPTGSLARAEVHADTFAPLRHLPAKWGACLGWHEDGTTTLGARVKAEYPLGGPEIAVPYPCLAPGRGIRVSSLLDALALCGTAVCSLMYAASGEHCECEPMLIMPGACNSIADKPARFVLVAPVRI